MNAPKLEPQEKTSSKKPWNVLEFPSAKEKRLDFRRLTQALLATIILHLVLWEVLPYLIQKTSPETVQSAYKPLEVEYEFVKPQVFQEVNPNAVVEEPEDTPNIAKQSQVSAQENPLPKPAEDNTPTIDGEMEDSQKIVQGSLKEAFPEPFLETNEPQNEISEPVQAQEKQQQFSAHSTNNEYFHKIVEPSMGAGNAFEEPKEAPEVKDKPALQMEKKVAKEKTVEPEAYRERTKRSRPMPKERPRVQHKVIPGPLKKSIGSGATRLGQTAIDARFSQYGAYLDRMFEAIFYQWSLLMTNYNYASEDFNSAVEVRFKLSREGKIVSLEVRNSSASQIATLICKDAVNSLSPFDPWTEEMVASLGDEQEIGIRFHYR